MNTLTKKWWVILIQGILLILLSIFIFNNPEAILTGISFWFGIIVLAAGILGLAGWLIAGKEERETSILIWSLLTAILGILMLTNVDAIMKVLTIVFGLWVILTGITLASNGWMLKNSGFFGWILLIIGILSIVCGIFILTNTGAGAAGISTILGIQLLLSGIGLVLLSFTKKAIANKIKAS